MSSKVEVLKGTPLGLTVVRSVRGASSFPQCTLADLVTRELRRQLGALRSGTLISLFPLSSLHPLLPVSVIDVEKEL